MDLISRQAILKHIEKTRQGALMMDDIREASIVMTGMYMLEEAVRNQPSVQPDVPDIIVGDMISRQAAIDALDAACVKYDISPHYDDKRSDKEKFFDWWDMYKVLSMKILNNLPSTQPPLCGYNIEHLICLDSG